MMTAGRLLVTCLVVLLCGRGATALSLVALCGSSGGPQASRSERAQLKEGICGPQRRSAVRSRALRHVGQLLEPCGRVRAISCSCQIWVWISRATSILATLTLTLTLTTDPGPPLFSLVPRDGVLKQAPGRGHAQAPHASQAVRRRRRRAAGRPAAPIQRLLGPRREGHLRTGTIACRPGLTRAGDLQLRPADRSDEQPPTRPDAADVTLKQLAPRPRLGHSQRGLQRGAAFAGVMLAAIEVDLAGHGCQQPTHGRPGPALQALLARAT